MTVFTELSGLHIWENKDADLNTFFTANYTTFALVFDAARKTNFHSFRVSLSKMSQLWHWFEISSYLAKWFVALVQIEIV